MYDIAVIGAGVIGTSIARELCRNNLSVIILEKENDVACGATKANSAIVHAGYNEPPGTMRARMNVLGNAMFDEFCKVLNVPFERIGSLVVAFSNADMDAVRELYENGKKLGVPNLRIVDAGAVYEMEPNLNPGLQGALFAPSAGITEPWEIAVACAENALDNGAELRLNFEVVDIEELMDAFVIRSESESVKAKYLINCAGIHADDVHDMVSDMQDFKLHPRRGHYYLLDRETEGYVRHVIFPCPSELGKGTLILPTVEGNILVGPDSEDLSADMKSSVETTANRLGFVRAKASQLSEEIPFDKKITEFSGLRAEPDGDDFIIGWSKSVRNFYNVAGIKSPGLSSAPAIADYVRRALADEIGMVGENTSFNPHRRPRVRMSDLDDRDRQAMIDKDPRYGRIICRCEMISEGEIADAIHRSAGGRTLNGIKRRTRPGSGRCQGGFCGPRVLDILARELNLDPLEVAQEGKNARILSSRTKETGGGRL